MEKKYLNLNHEPSYGFHIDNLLKEMVVAHMSKNNNFICDHTIKSYLMTLINLHHKSYLLRENGGKNVFGKPWVSRALARWKIYDRKFPTPSNQGVINDVGGAVCQNVENSISSPIKSYRKNLKRRYSELSPKCKRNKIIYIRNFSFVLLWLVLQACVLS